MDGIRLNVDHRRFGYDDWLAASSEMYRFAQERGVQVYIDCAIESRYDQIENPPKPLPIRKADDPDTFFKLMGEMTEKMLRSSADGCSSTSTAATTIAHGKRSPQRKGLQQESECLPDQ